MHNLTINSVQDAVADLGMDPNSGDTIRQEVEAIPSNTLVTFPDGNYYVDGSIRLENQNDIAFMGSTGATWDLAANFTGPFLRGLSQDSVDNIVFQGIDIDQNAYENQNSAHFDFELNTYGRVEEVEFLGRGKQTGYTVVMDAMTSGGLCIVRRVRSKTGDKPDAYNSGNGRIGVFSFVSHVGTLRVLDCEFSEYGNNGTYTSKTQGAVQIEDCYFLNAAPNSVRISGVDNWGKRNFVETDFPGKYEGPAVSGTFGFTHYMCENENPTRSSTEYPIDTDVDTLFEDNVGFIRDLGDHADVEGVFQQDSASRNSIHRRNLAYILDDAGSGRTTHAFLRVNPFGDFEDYRSDMEDPPEPHDMHIEDCRVIDEVDNDALVRITRAAGSTVDSTRMTTTGSSRDGVYVINGQIDGSTISVTDNMIDVSGDSIDVPSGATVSGNTFSGSVDDTVINADPVVISSADGSSIDYTLTIDDHPDYRRFVRDYQGMMDLGGADSISRTRETTTVSGTVVSGQDGVEVHGMISDITTTDATNLEVTIGGTTVDIADVPFQVPREEFTQDWSGY